MTDPKALTPRPPLPGGEGEEPTEVYDLAQGREHTEFDGSQGVIRNQWVSPVKLDLAKYFRKHSTEYEEAVWQMLRNRQIDNLKWRRQQVIDGFIADFYCAELNVVLEIDGPIHEKEKIKEYDAYRTSVFEEKGIKTFRLRNEDCDEQHLKELIENIITSLR
ncbi:MAG: DUF559 domain-containing protein [Bacteroidales bacterium]|nr:DUF559 domain-containing protein [Bacteroidales bacterium]